MASVAMERVLDSLYERVSAASTSDFKPADSRFMETLCNIYGLRHTAYITVDKRSFISRQPKFLVTYPVEWQEEYRRSFAEQKDPVMQAGLSELLPFDWKALKERKPEADRLFGAAREFGIGRQGLTIPIRGRAGTRALFSVTGDLSDKEWQDFSKEYLKDFVILANYFHKKINGETEVNKIKVTDREREILQLCSYGYTAVNISRELDISVSTVKYFLNQIKFKFNTLNTTQSVAKAISMGIVVDT